MSEKKPSKTVFVGAWVPLRIAESLTLLSRVTSRSKTYHLARALTFYLKMFKKKLRSTEPPSAA